MPWIFYAALAVFLLSFLLIIAEKIHSTVIALAGAVLMILLGVLTQESAIAGVDFNTLGLLIGMMVLVGIAKESGMFQAVALFLAKAAKGNPKKIFWYLSLVVVVFSALLDNVTTVLLMAPVAIVIANNLRISPYPYFIGTILLSNIGGAATLIGDPPNIMIGSAAGLTFNDFVVHLSPICLLIAVVTTTLLLFWYKRELVATPEAQASIMRFSPKEAILDMPLLKHSLIAIGVVLVGFATHGITHLEGATIALGGAALLLLLSLRDPENHLRDIEWTTIFFFLGLFVLVAGLVEVGVIWMIAEYIISAVGQSTSVLMFVLLWGSSVVSAVVNNIPFVAAMIPLIHDIGALTGMPTEPLWWSLALGASIGGNATLVGASANLIVAGIAKKEGEQITFWGFMKVAAPLTIIALLLCSIYVFVRYSS